MPVLILVACALMAVQPRLTAWIARAAGTGRSTPAHDGGPLLLATVYATGIYGGYFGAGQGIILIALLAILIADDLQRLNGLKNAIAVVVNAVAAVLFIAVAPVAWEAGAPAVDRLDRRRPDRRDRRPPDVAAVLRTVVTRRRDVAVRLLP